MDVITKPRERSTHKIVARAEENPYERAAFSPRHRLARLIWQCTYLLLYRISPRPFHAWRSMILRVFGAKIGPGCHFYPAGKVWAPWNLVCDDCCTLADGAEIYNPSPFISNHTASFLSKPTFAAERTITTTPSFP
jgi:putative colanic acid biosynthesis acetyltransferase WcaF